MSTTHDIYIYTYTHVHTIHNKYIHTYKHTYMYTCTHVHVAHGPLLARLQAPSLTIVEHFEASNQVQKLKIRCKHQAAPFLSSDINYVGVNFLRSSVQYFRSKVRRVDLHLLQQRHSSRQYPFVSWLLFRLSLRTTHPSAKQTPRQ